MEITPELDIVIVNYNSTDYLLRCLKSVYQDLGSRSANIFVADNGSTDNIDRICDQFPGVHLLRQGKNLGFARAVNACMINCQAPFLLILNPDSVIIKGFFNAVLNFMETRTDIGIMGPRIYDPDYKVQGSARAFPTPSTAMFGRSSILTRLFPNNRMSRKNLLHAESDGKQPMEVDWVSGACMLVRREAIDQVGEFDCGFFMYWEDADWCRRMAHEGWRVVYFPGAAVLHHVGVSSEQNLPRSVIEFHKSAYYYFKKHVEWPYAVFSPIIWMALFTRIGFVFIYHGVRLWQKKTKMAAVNQTEKGVEPGPYPLGERQ